MRYDAENPRDGALPARRPRLLGAPQEPRPPGECCAWCREETVLSPRALALLRADGREAPAEAATWLGLAGPRYPPKLAKRKRKR